MEKTLVFVSFKAIESIWKSMEKDGTAPFLCYDYMQYIVREERLNPFHSVRVACVKETDSDRVLMIVPLLLVRGSVLYYRMLGDTSGCEITDALFRPGLTPEEIHECIIIFFNQIQRPLALNRLPDDSAFLKGIPKDRIKSDKSVTYVNIQLPPIWENYIPSLSTNSRQNVRKAYRRMENDGIDFKLTVYSTSDNPLPNSVWRKMMNIYCNRRKTKYRNGVFSSETKGGIIVQSIKYLYYITIKCLWFRTKHDARSLREEPNARHIVLWGGDEIMAFMSGFLSNDAQTFSVPRVAINDRFRFYSPGCLLVSETIHHFINSPLKNLDLSRGDESYKFKMGGIAYYTHDIVLT